jgi:hypothetical protein
MKNTVRISAHPETGAVTTQTANPEFSYYVVKSKSLSYDKNGWEVESNRSAMIMGKTKSMQSRDLKDGQILPGKIILLQSFEPFIPGQAPKINPTTGESVLTNGKESFMKTVYTEDMNAFDTWITEDVAESVTTEAENAATNAL